MDVKELLKKRIDKLEEINESERTFCNMLDDTKENKSYKNYSKRCRIARIHTILELKSIIEEIGENEKEI